MYLLGSQDHRHHTLRLSGLGALINQDGAELHLGQARITSPDTGAADHVSILDNREKFNLQSSNRRGNQDTVVKQKNSE